MTSVEPAPFFIDPRDGSKELMRWEPVKSSAELCQMDFGDALICGKGANSTIMVGIEVKSIWDLISSIDTGRLQATQLPGLIRSYDITALLYYGQTRLGRNGELELWRPHGKQRGWNVFKLGTRPVPYGYLEAFLWEVAVLGIHVQHVEDERTAAAWLGVVHRWWSREWSDHKAMRTLDRSRDISLMPHMNPATLQRVKVAAQLPAIGFDRATNAAEYFPSVRAMINADADEWVKVKGVGKTIAKAIIDAVR